MADDEHETTRVRVETLAQRMALEGLVARQFSERSQSVLWVLALGIRSVEVPCSHYELAEACVQEALGLADELEAVAASTDTLTESERLELLRRVEGMTELMLAMRAEEPPESLWRAA